MGNCEFCTTGSSEDAALINTQDHGKRNERWAKAVLDGNFVGCQYVHLDDQDVIDQVVDIKTGEHAIHIAVKTHNTHLLEFLQQHHVNVDSQTYDTKNTALHLAAAANNVNMIRALLMMGADVDIRNAEKKLPRDLCTKNIKREFNRAKVNALRYAYMLYIFILFEIFILSCFCFFGLKCNKIYFFQCKKKTLTLINNHVHCTYN